MNSVEPLKRPRIGKAFAPQKEAWLKVTGRAIYTHDFSLPDMLWGAVLRSPHPHARIVAIDTTRAEGMPGVRAVITSADAPDRYVHLGPRYADRYPLAHGRVRFVGEEVAAVAADTREQAQAAAAAIEVQYEVLPAVFGVERALSPSAPVLHQREGLPANVAQRTAATWGDVTGGDAHTAHTVHGTFSHGVVIPVCMETNAVVAAYDAVQQRLDMWAGTQSPYFARKEMAHILGLQTQQVRVHSIEIGGGFGGKSQAPEPLGIAALLSRKAGRPVKIVLSRQEEFLAGKTDHAKSMTLTTAVDAEGKILLRRNHYTVDNGAFTHMGPAYISAVRQRTSNLYRVGAVEFEGRLVYTNKVPGGSYRGMGAPQSIWALETQVDELAEQLGKDPLQYRIELANQSGDVTPQGFEISTCGLVECLREVVQQTRTHLEQLPPQASRHRAGLSAFLSRLYWHCHFIQKLESEPDIEFRNMHRGYDGLREEAFNPHHLAALQSARTGWPMVDACVIMLRQTGWLNFRMRAMLVSVAAYPLWLHWRPVGEWLATQFLDYEPGIHWSQMQMQSGTTGINTTRVYNPIKQAQDHDPHGIFQRHWLQAQYGYEPVAPIVDLSTATRRAKDLLHDRRRDPQVRQGKQAVLERHASRRLSGANSRRRRTEPPPSAQLSLDL